MLATYAYLPGAATADVLADIVAIYTGETNKANLSAACDQAATEILSSEYASTWTMWDAIDSTNVYIRSQYPDDPLSYRYIQLSSNGAQILMQTALSQDNVTHAPSFTVTLAQNINHGSINVAGGIFYIAMGAKFVLLKSGSSAYGSAFLNFDNIPGSWTDTSYRSTNTSYGLYGYNHQASPFGGVKIPRYNYNTNSDSSYSAPQSDLFLPDVGNLSTPLVFNTTGSREYLLANYLLIYPHTSSTFVHGRLSWTSTAKVLVQASTFVNHGDDVVIGGVTYFAFYIGAYSGFLTTSPILVPKG